MSKLLEGVEVKLKNCPFCGNEAGIEYIKPHTHTFAVFMQDCKGECFISCNVCGASVCGESGERAIESAIESWNNRVYS